MAKTDDDPVWQRRWQNAVGRTARMPYIGEPLPSPLRLPDSVRVVEPGPLADEPVDGDGFGASQACAVVGVTHRQLDYWARTGLARPSLSEAKGIGVQRLYSFDDLVRLRMIKHLLDQGLSLQRTRSVLDGLDGPFDETATVVVHGAQAEVVPGDQPGRLVELVQASPGAFVLLAPLGSVVAEVRRAIAQLSSAPPAFDEEGAAEGA